MARYYRRYRRYRPRRYVRRWFRRRFRRYVNGSSKSSVRMKTSVEGNFTVTSGASGAVGDTIAQIIAFADDNNPANRLSVLNSPLYRTYTNLYDQVKCIGMKVSVSIVDAIGGSTLPSVQIYTAWDRNHLSASGTDSPTGPQLKNASTYSVATALNNNVAKITRSIYASDLMERAMWHDCTLSHLPEQAPTYWRDNVYATSKAFPFFSPAFFMAIATPTLSAAATVNVACSVVYYMAFRNPKYGASAGLATLDNLGSRAISVPDGDGDIDDPTGARANVALAAALVDDEMMDDLRGLEATPAATAAAATVSQTTKIRARKAAAARAADPVLGSRPPPN